MRGFAEIDQVMAAISGIFLMADIRLTQGRLDQAQQIYENALNYIEEQEAPDIRGAEVSLLGLSEVIGHGVNKSLRLNFCKRQRG